MFIAYELFTSCKCHGFISINEGQPKVPKEDPMRGKKLIVSVVMVCFALSMFAGAALAADKVL